MNGISPLHLLARLMITAVFAGIIGLERESHGRPAGLRTHILVAVGSCLVMLLSIYGFGTWKNRDPARLAAQVISGIGFLGAGTILREGATIKGLTTAASLWVVAGIGLAIGGGFYLGGVAAALIVVMVLFFLEKVEKRYISPKISTIEAAIADEPGRLGEMCTVVGRYGFSIRAVDLERDESSGKAAVTLQVEAYRQGKKEELLEELRRVPGLQRLNWR